MYVYVIYIYTITQNQTTYICLMLNSAIFPREFGCFVSPNPFYRRPWLLLASKTALTSWQIGRKVGGLTTREPHFTMKQGGFHPETSGNMLIFQHCGFAPQTGNTTFFFCYLTQFLGCGCSELSELSELSGETNDSSRCDVPPHWGV